MSISLLSSLAAKLQNFPKRCLFLGLFSSYMLVFSQNIATFAVDETTLAFGF
jgi:hypothetical protein